MANFAATVHSLLHALATPLTVLMSAGDILRSRVPGTIEQPVHLVDDLSHQFGREVVELRASLGESIDLHSSAKAAEQIRQLAADWRRYEVHLSELIDEIEQAGIQMQEPLLDRILHQNLPGGLSELRQVLLRLEAIQPKDLTPS
ncbi:MAG TPA: hypothetical protein DEP36_10790 [Gammaproteobacteria bacterium]|nr:hypothetical protein [Gammaproteobacteria bacterium]HRF44604.1 hypothetical protein [Candidatus Competibacteraceae bacterium]